MDCAFCRGRQASKAGALPGAVSASGDPHVDALLWGNKWDDSSPITYWFEGGGGSISAFGTAYDTHAWSTDEKAAMRQGLQLWTRLTLLADAVEVASEAEADLKWYLIDGAWFLGAHYGPNGDAATQGKGFFNRDGTGWDDLSQGGYGWITVLHELGHALGLAHPHDGGGTSSQFPGVGAYWQYGDDRQNQNTFTVMSYLDVGADYNPASAVHYGFSMTPMAYDVAAIQHLYGASSSMASGDTTYELGVTDSGYTAIVDADGVDTLVYSGTEDAVLDLRAATGSGAHGGGYVSRAGQTFSGFTIAVGTVVENATGGSGSDVLRGNAADNVLTGTGGSNVLIGGLGTDTAQVRAGATLYKDRHHGAVHATGDGWEDVLVGVEHVYVGGEPYLLNYAGGEQWLTVLARGRTLHLKQHGTGSGQMEVHALSPDGQRWTLQTATPLPATFGGWQFATHPVSGNLACFKLSATESGRAELHVLSAASNYTQWVQHTATKLSELQHSWQLALNRDGDIIGIKKAATGSGTTEVHVLSARSGYQAFALQTATPLAATGAHWEFLVAPDNGDLVGIKKQRTSSGRTEVHVLRAAARFQAFALQTATALHETDDSWHFALDGARNLWAIKRQHTQCAATELHVLLAATSYQTFGRQVCTVFSA